MIRVQFRQAVAALRDATEWAINNFRDDIRGVFAGAVPFLKMWGITVGGWQMARAAVIAQRHLDAGEGDADFYRAKIATSRFFADHFLAQAPTLKHVIVAGAAGTLALADEAF